MDIKKFKKIIESIERADSLILSGSDDVKADYDFVFNNVCKKTYRISNIDINVSFRNGKITFWNEHWIGLDHKYVRMSIHEVKGKLWPFGLKLPKPVWSTNIAGARIPKDIVDALVTATDAVIFDFDMKKLQDNLNNLRVSRGKKIFDYCSDSYYSDLNLSLEDVKD